MEQKFSHFRDGFPSFAGMSRLVFKAVHRHRACLVKAASLPAARRAGWKPARYFRLEAEVTLLRSAVTIRG